MENRVRKLYENRIQDGTAVLEFVGGPDAGLVVRVALDEEVLLGTDPACSVALSDAAVSPTHLRVRSNGREVVIFDVEGSSGLFVGDDPVDYHILSPGDEVRIGDSRIRVAGGGDSPAPPARAPEIDLGREPESAMKIARQAIRQGLADPSAIQEAIREWEDARGRGDAGPFGRWIVERGLVSPEDLGRLAPAPPAPPPSSPAVPAARPAPSGGAFPPPGDVAISPDFLDAEIVAKVLARRSGRGWSDETILDQLEAELDRSRTDLERPLTDLAFMWN